MKNLFFLIVIAVFFLFPINELFSQNNLWVKNVTSDVGLDSARGSRIVVVDVNNDDYPDLLWGTGKAGKNRFYLYLNIENPEKQSPYKRIFTDFTEESGININRDSEKSGRIIDIASMADLDNDGDMDLVTSIYYHRLEYYKDTLDPGDRSEVYLNDGQGHFTLVSNNGLYDLKVLNNFPVGLINTTGLSFLDYDLDGNIDLYMATWYSDRAKGIGMPDLLMKGNGDGSFTDTKMSIITGNYFPMYGVNVTDWDNDGWPDILTSPYCNSNGNLFRNMQNGTFQDYSSQANYSAAHFKGDNGQALCQWEAQPADIDNDGDMDILQVFVHGGYNTNEGRTHLSRNQGQENGFRLVPELEAIVRDAPVQSHLGDQGGQWFDLNGDGLQDVAIGQMAYPQANTKGQERLYVCLQNEDGRFDDISKDIGIYYSIKEAHSMEPLDYDLDGDQDLFASHQVRDTTWRDTVINGETQKVVVSIKRYMQVVLLENNVADIVTNSNYHRWITVKLEAPDSCNKSSIGARIYVYSNGVQYMQDIQSGLGHFAGQQPFIRNFGLDYTPHNIDSIIVRWPRKDLMHTVAKGMPLNTVITIDKDGYKGYKKTWDMKKPILAVTNSNLNFGTVDIGSSKTMNIVLANLGETALNINSIEGIKSPDFTFVPDIVFPLTIQPGEQNAQTITLKFEPLQREEFSGDLLIFSNAFNDSIALVRYYAYGFENKPIITSDYEEYDFGSIYTDSSTVGIITIQNTGELDLIINGLDDIALPSAFVLKDKPDLPMTLTPDEKIELQVEFKPIEEKEYKAVFVINSNAYNEPDLHISLIGRGEKRKPKIQIQMTTYLFGKISIGQTREKTMNVKNIGTGELIIDNIEFEEDFEQNYLFKNFTLPVRIPPLSENDLIFEFKPTDVISYKTKLFVHSNSIEDSVFAVQFIGSGKDATGVDDSDDLEELITIYPNPAKGKIFIHLQRNANVKGVRIYDIMGQLIKVLDILNNNSEIVSVNLHDFPIGIYFLSVTTENEIKTYPLIIE